jgi:hypothetical protein
MMASDRGGLFRLGRFRILIRFLSHGDRRLLGELEGAEDYARSMRWNGMFTVNGDLALLVHQYKHISYVSLTQGTDTKVFYTPTRKQLAIPKIPIPCHDHRVTDKSNKKSTCPRTIEVKLMKPVTKG